MLLALFFFLKFWFQKVFVGTHFCTDCIECEIANSMSQPILLLEFVTAIRDLSDENLQSLQKQLTTSVQKLGETNEMLSDEIKTTTDASDLKIYKETINENKEVIANQQERLSALEQELTSRGLGQNPLDEGVYL